MPSRFAAVPGKSRVLEVQVREDLLHLLREVLRPEVVAVLGQRLRLKRAVLLPAPKRVLLLRSGQ